MQYLYRLLINFVKRLIAYILALILSFIPIMVVMFHVSYLILWLVDHNFDNPPPFYETWYMWPIIVITVIGQLYFMNRLENWLLLCFRLESENIDS